MNKNENRKRARECEKRTERANGNYAALGRRAFRDDSFARQSKSNLILFMRDVSEISQI